MNTFKEFLTEKALFVIFKDNEPFEVVNSRKEAKDNVDDYNSHKDKGKYEIKPLSKIEDVLKKTKPKSFDKLQKLKAQNSKVN